jgi:hypothetical protein
MNRRNLRSKLWNSNKADKFGSLRQDFRSGFFAVDCFVDCSLSYSPFENTLGALFPRPEKGFRVPERRLFVLINCLLEILPRTPVFGLRCFLLACPSKLIAGFEIDVADGPKNSVPNDFNSLITVLLC